MRSGGALTPTRMRYLSGRKFFLTNYYQKGNRISKLYLNKQTEIDQPTDINLIEASIWSKNSSF